MSNSMNQLSKRRISKFPDMNKTKNTTVEKSFDPKKSSFIKGKSFYIIMYT